jgi:hypothetical protein
MTDLIESVLRRTAEHTKSIKLGKNGKVGFAPVTITPIEWTFWDMFVFLITNPSYRGFNIHNRLILDLNPLVETALKSQLETLVVYRKYDKILIFDYSHTKFRGLLINIELFPNLESLQIASY